ncbi:MAG: YdcF family protein, partial [Candidatus Peregrinibacteria bacterium]|nr:YdcF family protein [Candidatus Peregrinibacteria bacterium]
KIISATYRAGLLIIGLLSILILILVARPLKECRELDIAKAEKVSHMIVLGAGLKGDQVSERLKLRLDKALEALEANNQIIAIVSGGQGSDEIISEAEAMKRYLVAAGTPEESILKEDLSRSTYENLLYSKEILDKLEPPEELMIVTSDFHIFRSRFIAKKLGWEVQTLCSKSEPHVLSNYMIREIPAVINDFIRQD